MRDGSVWPSKSGTGDTEKLRTRFGAAIGSFVKQIIDEQALAKAERKAGQMHRSPSLSAKVRLIKLSFKVADVREPAHRPPNGLDAGRTGRVMSMNQEGCLRAFRNKRNTMRECASI